MPHHNEQSVRVLRTVCIFRSYDGKSENSDKIISAFTCLPTRSLCDARDLCWSHPVPPIQTPFKTHSSAPRLTANRRIDNAPHNPPRLPAFIRSTVDTVLLIYRQLLRAAPLPLTARSTPANRRTGKLTGHRTRPSGRTLSSRARHKLPPRSPESEAEACLAYCSPRIPQQSPPAPICQIAEC